MPPAGQSSYAYQASSTGYSGQAGRHGQYGQQDQYGQFGQPGYTPQAPVRQAANPLLQSMLNTLKGIFSPGIQEEVTRCFSKTDVSWAIWLALAAIINGISLPITLNGILRNTLGSLFGYMSLLSSGGGFFRLFALGFLFKIIEFFAMAGLAMLVLTLLKKKPDFTTTCNMVAAACILGTAVSLGGIVISLVFSPFTLILVVAAGVGSLMLIFGAIRAKYQIVDALPWHAIMYTGLLMAVYMAALRLLSFLFSF